VIIAMLINDVTLLLTMLVGLLRLRHHDGGRFDLGRLLWKQVRWSPTSSVICALLIKLISLCKGIIYLLIATATEVTQVVRPASPHLRLHSPLTISIIRCRCSFVWI